MVCGKCGNDSSGIVCEKCGAPLISRLDDDKGEEEVTTPETVPETVPETTPVAAPTEMQTIPVQIPQQPVEQQVAQPTPQPVAQPSQLQQVPIEQVQPTQVIPQPVQVAPAVSAPIEAAAVGAVAVDATQMAAEQVGITPPVADAKTGTAAIEGVSDTVMNDVSIPSDFRLSDDPEDDEFDPVAATTVNVDDESDKKHKAVGKGKKKPVKKAIRKIKHNFGKLIVLTLLMIGLVYFYIYYVEPSGFLIDIFNR